MIDRTEKYGEENAVRNENESACNQSGCTHAALVTSALLEGNHGWWRSEAL